MQTHIVQVVKNKNNIGSKEEDMTYCLRCKKKQIILVQKK